MIKNIIFDLGNVVVKLRFNEYLEKIIQDKNKIELFKSVIFDSKEWQELDGGTITKENAIKIMKSKVDKEDEKLVDEIMSSWGTESLEYNEEIISFIKEKYDEGYNLYVLSNAPLDCPVFINRPELKKYFKGIILSAEVKMLKPNDNIYELLINRYNINPEESLFLDDKLENVKGAIRNNINSYQFDYNDYFKFRNDIIKLYNIK